MYPWYVITGGPCSGKTTMINEFSKLGFHIVPELARVLIDKEIKTGKSLEEIRRNEIEFQKKVLLLKIEIENITPKEKIVFFDRAIPDSIAYYEILGVSPGYLIKFCKKKRYRKIFFLEQLPFQKDYARTENKEEAKKLSELLFNCYLKLGYKIIRIPVLPVKYRLNAILLHVEEVQKV